MIKLLVNLVLSVIQEHVPPGCAEIKHYHQQAEQFFFVLSGIATIECGDKVTHLKPHCGLHIRAGIAHKLSNVHSTPLIFTVTSTPPTHGDRVEV